MGIEAQQYETEADSVHCLAASTSSETTHNFSPEFVYPIFGEQEVIYGYRDLVIKLFLASGSLKSYLGIEYVGTPVAGDRALDIEKTLRDFIPAGESRRQRRVRMHGLMRLPARLHDRLLEIRKDSAERRGQLQADRQ